MPDSSSGSTHPAFDEWWEREGVRLCGSLTGVSYLRDIARAAWSAAWDRSQQETRERETRECEWRNKAEATLSKPLILTAEATTPAPPQEISTRREPMIEQIPTIGRIVHYKLTADDAAQINRRRTTGGDIAARMKTSVESQGHNPRIFGWPEGAQAHIGNEAREGDVFPMQIVKTWGDTATSSVNGQVFLDGNDVFWATSRTVGDQPGQFSWPTRS